MAASELPAQSYVKHAFTDQHNLVLLFGAACFSVAFASPLPLAVGAAGELLWLAVGPRLPAFRAWVDARFSAQYLARAESAIESALGELSEAEASRFVTFSHGALELIEHASRHAAISALDLQLAMHSLLELRRTFLDYQFLAQRVVGLLEITPATELEREATRLQEEYAVERELNARMSIRQALTLAQKRLRQQQELQTMHGGVESRLEMLEEALPALALRLAEPGLGRLSQRVEAALLDIGPAETLEIAVDATFDGPELRSIR